MLLSYAAVYKNVAIQLHTNEEITRPTFLYPNRLRIKDNEQWNIITLMFFLKGF